MRLKTYPRKQNEQNLIPLINIVFLILIFFLVASTIRPFTEPDVTLAQAQASGPTGQARRLLVLKKDGTILMAGEPIAPADLDKQLSTLAQKDSPLTIVADAELNGRALIDIVTRANAAGVEGVKLMTQRRKATP